MPRISLLAASPSLPKTDPSAAGSGERRRAWMGHTHSVLEARLVSSCLSFPSRARPRLSRLLARNGVTVKTLQKVELGGTTSLRTESAVSGPWTPSSWRNPAGTHSDSSEATVHLY